MEVILRGNPKEIVALVLEIQEQRGKTKKVNLCIDGKEIAKGVIPHLQKERVRPLTDNMEWADKVADTVANLVAATCDGCAKASH